MPPKKKKGGKKSSGKKKSAKETSSKTGVNIEDVFNEVSKEFYLMQIRDLEQKIARYQDKCDKLELLNKEIQENFDQQAADKKSIVSFLKNEGNKKSNEIMDLQEQVKSLEEKRNEEQKEYEMELAKLKTQMSQMNDKLTSENMVLNGKLKSLEDFKAQREKLMQRDADKEERLRSQEKEHKEQIYQLERKAVVDKDRLKKEMILRVNTVAAEFRKVSNKQMADTTKRAISENVMINSQLAKMSDKTMELISENDEMKATDKAQRQNIEIMEDNEKELMKKNAMHKKLIMMLTEKSREQEACLEEFVEREVKIKQLEEDHHEMSCHFQELQLSEQTTRGERDSLSNRCELFDRERTDLIEDKQYLISILSDASYVIKQALQHNDTGDAAATEMRNTNLLQKVVEILNLAAEMGVGIDPEDLALARNSHKKKKKQVYLGPIQGKRETMYEGLNGRKAPEAHYNLGDLGLVPSPARTEFERCRSNNSSQKHMMSGKSSGYLRDKLPSGSSSKTSRKETVRLPYLASAAAN